jgi:predicted amidohydrolase
LVIQRAAASVFEDDGALARNVAEVVRAIRDAKGRADLVVLPELCLTGYIPLKGYDQRRKAILWQAARRLQADHLKALLEATGEADLTAALGLPEPSGPRYEMFNSAALLEAGRLLGYARKAHLPVEENHYFVPGPSPRVLECRLGRLGLMICYDLFFPETARLLGLQGAEILVALSNWADIGNIRRLCEVLSVARALENQVHVIFCNGVGELRVREHRYTVFGHSRVVTAAGEDTAAGAGSEVLAATLRAADLLEGAAIFPVFRDRRMDLYGPLAQPYPGAT